MSQFTPVVGAFKILTRTLLLFQLLSPLSYFKNNALKGVDAFTAAPSSITRSTAVVVLHQSFLVDATAMEEEDSGFKPLHDGNGNQITVGSVVRVCAEGLKAFQIPPKGRGYFDEDKKFVPDKDKDTPLGLKYLIVPVGLRGVVAKVYENQLEVSANCPVQVKFTPGEHVDEGYDTPLPFLMHFTEREIEVVDP